MKIVYHLIIKKKYSYKLVAERIEKTEKLHNNIDFENLVNHLEPLQGVIVHIEFNDFIDISTLYNELNSHRIKLDFVEKNQMKFISKLTDRRIGGNKSGDQ